MSGDAMCSCGHIESAHRKMTNPACLAPTGYAFGAFSFGCSCTTFDAVSPGDEFRGPRNTIEESDELHDSPMFSAAVKESGSRTCANPGLSAPILSTPIVSPPASALRSAPISGYNADAPIPGDIADGNTSKAYRNQHASDITTTVAIQADEQTMSTDSASNDYERSDSVTVKISREDAEAMADFFTDPSERFLLDRLALACPAALEGER